MKVARWETASVSIQHPLLKRKWPRYYTADEYPSVIAAIQRNDSKIIDHAITSFIPLLGQIVGRYCHKLKSTNRSDDLMAAGLVGIIVAVHRVRDHGLGHENLGGYVVSYIHQHVSKCVEDFDIVRVPGGTIRSNKHRKQHIRERFQYHLLRESDIPQSSVSRGEDLLELAYSLCQCQLETDIVRLRYAGHTDKEISELLSVHRTTISKSRADIGRRLTVQMESDANV